MSSFDRASEVWQKGSMWRRCKRSFWLIVWSILALWHSSCLYCNSFNDPLNTVRPLNHYLCIISIITIWISRCLCVFSSSGFRISEVFKMSHVQWPKRFWSATERKKGVTTGAIEMGRNRYTKELLHKDLWVLSQASNVMHSRCCFQRRMLLCCCFLSFFPMTNLFDISLNYVS